MKNDLENIARSMRQTIESIIANSSYVDCELQNFPLGSCEVASIMTGLYLQKLGFSEVVQTVGKREISNSVNCNNHVWLTVDNKYIIDITADQFEDCNIPVIVEERTGFHDSFSIYETRPIDFNYLQAQGHENFYSTVLAKIEST